MLKKQRVLVKDDISVHNLWSARVSLIRIINSNTVGKLIFEIRGSSMCYAPCDCTCLVLLNPSQRNWFQISQLMFIGALLYTVILARNMWSQVSNCTCTIFNFQTHDLIIASVEAWASYNCSCTVFPCQHHLKLAHPIDAKLCLPSGNICSWRSDNPALIEAGVTNWTEVLIIIWLHL